MSILFVFFFFQAEDGIRDRDVTGVQTCALPILRVEPRCGRWAGGEVMQLAVEERGDVKIVRVQEAKLTYPVLSSFFTEVRQQVEAGTRKLVIDLQAVSYIDSASIGCLMEIHRLVQEKAGAVKLCGLQPRVETMISMAGVNKVIDLFREEADAVAVFGARKEASESTEGAPPPLVVRTSVAIDAPPSTVWAVLTTLRSMGEWVELGAAALFL